MDGELRVRVGEMTLDSALADVQLAPDFGGGEAVRRKRGGVPRRASLSDQALSDCAPAPTSWAAVGSDSKIPKVLPSVSLQ
jgi:hypothetical protein